jgi:hypothetical protein
MTRAYSAVHTMTTPTLHPDPRRAAVTGCPEWVKMRDPQNEDMFSGLHPIADITGSSGDKIASAGDWCDGGRCRRFGWQNTDRIRLYSQS